MSHSLEVNGLQLNHADGSPLLKSVNFSMNSGDIKIIYGPSGSGKSRLLKSLVGLIPMAEGSICLDGESQHEDAIVSYRIRVQYLAQERVHATDRVLDGLKALFQFRNCIQSFNDKEVNELLGQLDLDPSFLQRHINELSGGEYKVFQLIRSLLVKPNFLLLDELTGPMDRVLTEKVETLLQLLVKKGLGILMISHDPDQQERLRASTLHYKNFGFG